MPFQAYDRAAAWQVDDLACDKSWIYPIEDAAAAQLAAATEQAFEPDRPLFEYTQEDFDFGLALETIRRAFKEAHFGRGFSLVKGLPRARLSAEQFRILVWGIGLHLGVARPQGKASHYISEVRATGNVYRAAGGRGYNTNSSLDFHADGCDVVALACFNKAKAGGQSMVSSSVSAWETLLAERPDLAEIATGIFYFSRNQEEAPGENPYYGQPLFDFECGRIFGKWNRNRVRTAQDIAGVPQLTEAQRECTDLLDDILRRPNIMFTMWLEPGDLQFMNNHLMLHSRTEFEDFDEPERQRLLYRLWLAPPDSVLLPETWAEYFRSVTPGSVRGGIRGHRHDETCRAFEAHQAKALGMNVPPPRIDVPIAVKDSIR
ncbi:MAG: TauD/TfdA family dioxygenase [Rhodospirillaceae bacterium]